MNATDAENLEEFFHPCPSCKNVNNIIYSKIPSYISPLNIVGSGFWVVGWIKEWCMNKRLRLSEAKESSVRPVTEASLCTSEI